MDNQNNHQPQIPQSAPPQPPAVQPPQPQQQSAPIQQAQGPSIDELQKAQAATIPPSEPAKIPATGVDPTTPDAVSQFLNENYPKSNKSKIGSGYVNPGTKSSIISRNFLILIVITVVLIGGGIGAFFLVGVNKNSQQQITPTTMVEKPTISAVKPTIALTTPSITPMPPNPKADWKVFTDSLYGISLKYPQEVVRQQITPTKTNQVLLKLVYTGPNSSGSASLSDGYTLAITTKGSGTSANALAQSTYTKTKKRCSLKQATISAIFSFPLGGVDTKSYTGANCPDNFTENFLAANGTIFQISQTYAGSTTAIADYATQTQDILSTLVFSAPISPISPPVATKSTTINSE